MATKDVTKGLLRGTGCTDCFYLGSRADYLVCTNAKCSGYIGNILRPICRYYFYERIDKDIKLLEEYKKFKKELHGS